jgi:hypothetical protein
MSVMRFELRLEGTLSDADKAAFGDVRVTETAPQTIVEADVVDEAQLHGLIALCRRLGITVVSLHQVLD